MARKKRSIVTAVAPPTDAKKKPKYKDSFQQNVGKKVEEVGKQIAASRRTFFTASRP